jgi:NitT/TauT family transport system substrate-binding protein
LKKAAGQIEIGNSSNTAAFFNTIARGLHQPFVCDNNHLEPGNRGYMVVLRPDLAGTITRITDLRGRVNAVGAPLRDGGVSFTAKKMFDANGMSLDDVQWERLGFSDMLAALANSRIDVAWMIEPFITQGSQQGLLVPWLTVGDYYPGAHTGGTTFSESFIKNRNEVAKRWMVAMIRGTRDFNDFLKGRNRDIIAPLISAHTGLAPDVVDKVAFIPVHPDGRLNVQALMDDMRQLHEWGTITSLLSADQIVDHQFVDYAAQQLGPYRG